MQTTGLELRVEMLQARLDARRGQAEGQLGLFGGDGQPCGQSFIAKEKTCHKGPERPMEARRSRPRERIVFPHPIEGPTGAKLHAYTWQWTLEEQQDRHGEVVERRVSNWEQSLQNVETGREVVHQFEVEAGGERKVVSAESALKLMGFVDPDDKKRFQSLKSTARTVARVRMAQAELQQRREQWPRDWAEVEAMPKPPIEKDPWNEHAHYTIRELRMGDVYSHESYSKYEPLREGEAERLLIQKWMEQRMRDRGWPYDQRNSYGAQYSFQKEEARLAKRLQKAEAKLQQTAERTDAATGPAATPKEHRQPPEEPDHLAAAFLRLDALKRRCSTGYSCGSSCISIKKECRTNPAAATSKERLQRIAQLAKGAITPKGIGTWSPEEAKAKAQQLKQERDQQLAVIRAERERQKAAAAKEGRRPKVKVNLRRAKPGGEFGPDGHWYPGGAWMSEGNYVGAKPLVPPGQGQAAGVEGKGKGGNDKVRVIEPKKVRRQLPLQPKGPALPRPAGLKKAAAKNDEQFFNDDGYILYPQPKGAPSLEGTLFEAAVIQRLTTDELKWATQKIRDMARDPESRRALDDDVLTVEEDIARFGGRDEYFDYHRSFARNQLAGIDAERFIAGRLFMHASRSLGFLSPAQQRRMERQRNWETAETAPERPGPYGNWVWGLNNVFRAIRSRRNRP